MRGDFCTAPTLATRNAGVASDLTWGPMGEFDWRNDFAGVQTPVLPIICKSDIFRLASIREWEAAFPNARLMVLDRAGHYPHVERPEEFFRLVEDFLR